MELGIMITLVKKKEHTLSPVLINRKIRKKKNQII